MPKGISRITSIIPTIEGRQLLLLRSIESLIIQQLPEGVEHEILISFDSLNKEQAKQIMDAVEALKDKTSTDTPIRLIHRTTGSLAWLRLETALYKRQREMQSTF